MAVNQFVARNGIISLNDVSVTGSLSVTGSTTFVNPNLNYGDGVIGPELTTTATFTSGSDWSGSYNSWTHTSGSVSSSITSNLNAVIGNYYIIAVTNTGVTSGSSGYTFGGQGQSGMVLNGTYYTLGGKATTTAPLIIGTTGNFNGTVSVSVKQITPGTASFVLNNVSGSGGTEFRASNNNTTSTFVGFNSGRYNYVGTNTGFGYNALATNAGNTGNTAIGYNTLANLTQIGSSIPFNNTAVGSSAGQNITSGQANTLVGASAGGAITTGFNNTTVGSGAGQAITTGNNNLLIGLSAGAAITTGASNTLIGYQAGNTILTGNSNNTAVGSSALSGLTIGAFNVGIGANTGRALGTGGSTTLLGYNAGYNLANVNNNIAIGYNAGYYAGSGTTTNVTASNSLYLGYDVRASANGNTNEVVIAGYNGTTGSIGLGSNTTVIGNSSTTVTGLWGNLVLGGNAITGSATGSGYTLNVAAPSVSGSLLVSGSTVLSGSLNVTTGITGSLFGTSSYASNANSSSYATSASFASYAISASNAPGYTVQFTQATPATTWSFTHNLNTRNPIVQVYDTTYKQIIPNQIVSVDAFNAQVLFDYSQSGYVVMSNGGGLYVTGSTSLIFPTSSVTWSFQHNLNSQYINFTAYDSNNNVIIPSGIKAISPNYAEMYFATSQSGVGVAQFSGIGGSPNAASASYATTASYAISASAAVSSSYAATASYLSPVTSGYVVLSQVSSSLNFADDAAAAAGGVPIGGLYRNGNFILIRLS